MVCSTSCVPVVVVVYRTKTLPTLLDVKLLAVAHVLSSQAEEGWGGGMTRLFTLYFFLSSSSS